MLAALLFAAALAVIAVQRIPGTQAMRLGKIEASSAPVTVVIGTAAPVSAAAPENSGETGTEAIPEEPGTAETEETTETAETEEQPAENTEPTDEEGGEAA